MWKKINFVIVITCSLGLGLWLANYWPEVKALAQVLLAERSYVFQSSSEEIQARFQSQDLLEISWSSLLPEEDRDAITRYQVQDSDSLQEQILSTLLAANDESYKAAMHSSETVTTHLGKAIAISGFIVPLEYDESRGVTRFFLVPYFGACLHFPPPPPNQIIYVYADEGIADVDINQAYTLHGILDNALFEDPMGTSAYALELAAIRLYFGQPDDVRQHQDPF